MMKSTEKVRPVKVLARLVSAVILLTLSLGLVACNSNSPQHATSHNEWVWVGGANIGGQPGIYGALGVGATGSIPGARQTSAAWTYASGNFWLFGGNGIDSTGGMGLLNDLWRFTNGEWTWMSGAELINQNGVYGTQGKPTPANVPGARFETVGWVDTNGNLSLFGGYGAGYAHRSCHLGLQSFSFDLTEEWPTSSLTATAVIRAHLQR